MKQILPMSMSILLLCGSTNGFLLGPSASTRPYEVELHMKCPCDYILDPISATNKEQHIQNPDVCKLRPTWDHFECIKRYDHLLNYARLFPEIVNKRNRVKRAVTLDDIYKGIIALPKLAISAGTIIIKSLAEIVGVDEILGLTAAKIIDKLIGASNAQRENGTLVPLELTMEEIARVSTFANEPDRRAKLRSVAMSQPMASRAFEYIYDELSSGELCLAMIADNLKEGVVDTKSLGELTGYTDLTNIDPLNTKVRAVIYHETDADASKSIASLNFVFDVVEEYDFFSRIIFINLIIFIITITFVLMLAYLIYLQKWTMFKETNNNSDPRATTCSRDSAMSPAMSYSEPNSRMNQVREGVLEVLSMAESTRF